MPDNTADFLAVTGTVTDVRPFRDNDGHVTAVHITARADPAPVEPGADEPAFSGGSYLFFELFLDNPRQAATLAVGDSIRVTVGLPQKDGA